MKTSRPSGAHRFRDGHAGRHESAALGRAVKPSGLRRIKFHGLRHGRASHMLAAGASVKLVSDRLGHTNAALTLNIYSHVIGSQGADAAAGVAALVNRGTGQ